MGIATDHLPDNSVLSDMRGWKPLTQWSSSKKTSTAYNHTKLTVPATTVMSSVGDIPRGILPRYESGDDTIPSIKDLYDKSAQSKGVPIHDDLYDLCTKYIDIPSTVEGCEDHCLTPDDHCLTPDSASLDFTHDVRHFLSRMSRHTLTKFGCVWRDPELCLATHQIKNADGKLQTIVDGLLEDYASTSHDWEPTSTESECEKAGKYKISDLVDAAKDRAKLTNQFFKMGYCRESDSSQLSQLPESSNVPAPEQSASTRSPWLKRSEGLWGLQISKAR